MFYTIYKITNILNGKFYVGKHQTKDLNDGYMGSGKILKRAIEKHGIDNFQKEILFIFDNEQEMNDKEKELVTLHEMSYNLCPGGKGGFGYINENVHSIEDRRKFAKNNFTKEVLVKNGKLVGPKNLKKAHEEGKISYDNFTGKKHSEESKEKIRSKMKGRIPWNKGKAWKDWHPKASKF